MEGLEGGEREERGEGSEGGEREESGEGLGGIGRRRVGGESREGGERDELSRTTGKRMGKKWQNYRGYRYPPATGTEYRYLTTFLQNVLVVEQIFLPYQYIHNFTTRV